ncbi:MAG TPA: TIGR01777 family oxidoreductase [Candidatus Binatia bacterium]|nr:TIGR01777 family oxidoreductase [Candidatus Binatia bacterium]
MKLVVSGATGFIGSALCPRLTEKGHTLVLLTRSAPPEPATATKRWLHWTPGASGEWEKAVDGADGVINLVGEPIAARRWTAAQKSRIRLSRIESTRSLVEAAAKANQKPGFLVNASAVGYYGPRGDEPITEESPPGTDFLSKVCVEWEEEAKKAEPLGLRVVRLRTGIVLGPNGGALAKMVPPFKLFLGGPLGSGMQWMSWIHREDEVGLILHLIDDSRASGAVNATAPNPVRMKEFCQTLGKTLHRPCWAPVPAFALRLMLGEMADMLLTGQRVLPAAAQRLGYQFRYSQLNEALQACMPL